MSLKDVSVPVSLRVLLLVFLAVFACEGMSQEHDSLSAVIDTGQVVADTSIGQTDSAEDLIPEFSKNVQVNYEMARKLPPPSAAFEKQRKTRGSEPLFYLIMLIALLLGVLKISFPSYFNNLFRVFFNTSLRQNQLTDQLLQAMWPSLLFNLFFFISGGLYIYLFLGYFGKLDIVGDIMLLPLFMGGLLGVYIFKFIWLKFIGWVSGMPEELNAYIFIVYLVNKMAGICLLPFLPVIAFAEKPVVSVTMLLTVIMAGFMLVVRFLRSYSLAAARMRIPTLHFIIYIVCLEVLPLLILLKGAVLLLNKNL